MALSPDSPNESFLREVDENLRRERMETFAKTYGKWIAAAVLLFLAAIAGYLYWQDWQAKESAKRSEELSAIYDKIGAGKIDEAKAELKPLESSSNDMVRSLALLTQAAIALDSNDRDTALGHYRTLAADDDSPEAYRDLALVRATSIEFDRLKPEEVVSRLEPLAKPGNPWFGSAGELTAMAYLKQGQKDKAGRLFAAIAQDKSVPDTIRSRAVQIAGTLGIDTSKLLAETGQPGTNE